jgi:hypothetical protein
MLRLLGEGRPKPPLFARRREELLGRVLYHGPPWGWCPIASWAHEGSAWVAPPGGEAQATKVVGDELEAPKVNGFTEGEATTRQACTGGSDGDRTIRTSRGKARCKSPFLAHQLSMFSASTRIGWSRSHIPVLRWSCELQSTQWSIMVHALLGGNGPMSSGMILKMNMCYKRVSVIPDFYAKTKYSSYAWPKINCSTHTAKSVRR